ncbi:hypothetical protein EJF36_14495 [Bacillus sp. HMF5848]|nr:hypothetical protein EJF36_14495 [Bacillus sp. HMF5848]
MASILAIIIFFIVYIFLLTEKLDRALIAGTGGVLMFVAGIYDINKGFQQYIDWNTIALLLAMMILVSITSRTGVFEYTAIKMGQLVNGHGAGLLIVISCFTAIGSAFLANVTTVLLIVPVLLTITRLLQISAIPYLIAIIISSNIGGTATLIGDPPNIMIGQAVKHLTFNDFLVHLAPVSFFIFVVIISLLLFFYKDAIKVTAVNREKLSQIDAKSFVVVDATLVKALTVLIVTIAGFIFSSYLNLDLTTVALAGAVLLLLLTYKSQPPEEILRQVDWATLFFFIGLFMLVGGLEETGIISELSRSIVFFTEGDLPKTALLILWMTGLFSGFVDNIPFVAAMIPVVFEFQDYGMKNLDPLWWSMALGACLGGNGTLLGSSSNLVVAGLAAKAQEPIAFLKFLKIGMFTVMLSLAISTVYIYIRYLIPFL